MENTETELNDQLIVKEMRSLLDKFDGGEKRNWPQYLIDLRALFLRSQFGQVAQLKTHRVINDCTRIFARVLSTKLFPDILQEAYETFAAFSASLGPQCHKFFAWIFKFCDSPPYLFESQIFLFRLIKLIAHKNHPGLLINLPKLFNHLKKVRKTYLDCEIIVEISQIFLTVNIHHPTFVQARFREFISTTLIFFHNNCQRSLYLRKEIRKCIVQFKSNWIVNYKHSLSIMEDCLELFQQHWNLIRTKFMETDQHGQHSFDSYYLYTQLNDCACQLHLFTAIMQCLTSTANRRSVLFSKLSKVVELMCTIFKETDIFQKVLTLKRTFYTSFEVALSEFFIQTIAFNKFVSEPEMPVSCDSVTNAFLETVILNLKDEPNDHFSSVMRLMIALESKESVDQRSNCLEQLKTFKFSRNRFKQDGYFAFVCRFASENESDQLIEWLKEDLFNCFNVLLDESKLTDKSKEIITIKSHLASIVHWLNHQKRNSVQLSNLKLISLFSFSQLSHLNMIKQHSNLQLLVLRVLYICFQRNNHFTLAYFSKQIHSDACETKSDSEKEENLFPLLLQLMFDLLKSDHLSDRVRHLAITWLDEIIQKMQPSELLFLLKTELPMNLFRQIALCALFANDSTLLNSINIVCSILRLKSSNEIPLDFLHLFQLIYSNHVSSSNEKIRSRLLQTNYFLPSFANQVPKVHFYDFVPTSHQEKFVSLKKTANHNLLFTSSLFNQVWFLLTKTSFDDTNENGFVQALKKLISDQCWLELLTSKNRTSGSTSSLDVELQNTLENHSIWIRNQKASDILTWCCEQTVKYIVCNKLQTSFGKPAETLKQIELFVKQLAIAVDRPADVSQEIRNKSISQVKFTISLLETLERFVFICAQQTRLHKHGLPVSDSIFQFFLKNKNVCSEWIQLFRWPLVNMASKCLQPSTVWRHSERLIENALSKKQAIEPIVVKYADALIDLQEPEALESLRCWYRQNATIENDWLEASIQEAKENYTDAIELYYHSWKAVSSQFQDNFNSESVTAHRSFKCVITFVSHRFEISLSKLHFISNHCFPQQWTRLTEMANSIEIDQDLSAESEKVNNLLKWDALQTLTSEQKAFERICFSKTNLVQNNEELKSKLNLLKQKWLVIFDELNDEDLKYFQELKVLINLANFMIEKNENGKDNLSIVSSCCPLIDFKSKNSSNASTLLKAANCWKSVNEINSNNCFAHLPVLAKETRKTRQFDLAMQICNQAKQNYSCLFNSFDLPTLEQTDNCHSCHSAADFFNLNAEHSKIAELKGNLKECFEIRFDCFSKSSCSIQSLNPTARNSWSKIATKVSQMLLLYQNNELSTNWKSKAFNFLRQIDENKFDTLIKNQTLDVDVQPLYASMLMYSTQVNPLSAKNWLLLANWYYDHMSEGKVQTAIDCYFEFVKLFDQSNKENVTFATIRIIRLITDYGQQLKTSIEKGFEQTPSKAWHSVTLQLLALLKKGPDFVRKCIESLFLKMTEIQSVISHQILAVSSQSTSIEDLVRPESWNSLKNNCVYFKILHKLVPQMCWMQTFVQECERIALLWDELWLNILIRNLGDMQKIVKNLKQKAHGSTKTASNLWKEKANPFSSILTVVKKAQSTTSRNPETKHEEWFQLTYSKHISQFVEVLTNQSDADVCLKSYFQMIQLLQNRQAHSCPSLVSSSSAGRSELITRAISPSLHSFRNTSFSIPGIRSSGSNESVKFERIHQTCQALLTKTRPKKLTFYASNGVAYSFLLKGEDNLFLEERIMKLIETSNQLLASHARKLSANQRQNWKTMQACHYSVIPLTAHCGLIQWVNGTSLLSIYNRYRSFAQTMEVKNDSEATTTNAKLPKFTEMFYKRLQAKGVQAAHRAQWPVDTLIQVYQELQKETPSDLIANELWLSSSSCHHLWMLTKRFIQSTAIMSMVGFLIGLGDRHLDNLLLDTTNGELIHVDYNICFERGESLLVPERVPCRLSPNIVHAMTKCGFEGTFRSLSSDVLSVLRQKQHIFVTLLESLFDDLTFENAFQLKWMDSSLSSNSEENWQAKRLRVQNKLNGLDSESNQTLTSKQQVDVIVREATNQTNLARMYEGWTPWV